MYEAAGAAAAAAAVPKDAPAPATGPTEPGSTATPKDEQPGTSYFFCTLSSLGYVLWVQSTNLFSFRFLCFSLLCCCTVTQLRISSVRRSTCRYVPWVECLQTIRDADTHGRFGLGHACRSANGPQLAVVQREEF
jgi:hypothetical protein